MKETYNLILNSHSSVNRSGSNKRSYQYFVNWNAVLPKPYDITQKFHVRFSFMTPSVGSFGEVWLLSIDFGGSNTYDQLNSRSSYLGHVYPVTNTGATTSGTNSVFYYSKATPIDNLPICIEYPNNNNITVSLVNLNANYPAIYFNNDYILNLEFTPIN